MTALASPARASGWRRTVRLAGAAGLGAAAAAGALWLVRIPLAEGLIRGALSGRGVDASLTVTRADFGALQLENVRLGASAAAPDFAARRLTVAIGWGPLPRATAVSIEGGTLRGRLGTEGFTFGQLDRLAGPAEPARAARLPNLRLRIQDGTLVLATPLGEIRGAAEAAGALGRNFAGQLRFAPQTAAGPAGERIEGLSGTLEVRSDADGLFGRLAAEAGAFEHPGARASGRGLRLSGEAGLDPTLLRLRITAEANGDLSLRGLDFGGLALSAAAQTEDRRAGLDPAAWRLEAAASARSLAGGALSMEGVRLHAALSGAQGPFRLEAAGLRGGGLAAGATNVEGRLALTMVENGALSVRARGMLDAAGVRAQPQTRARWIAALPELGGTPAEPLMAAAKPALAQALTGVAVRAPLLLSWSRGAGALWLSGPLRAEAASGARLRLEAEDGGVARLTFPEGALRGAGRASLEGGGLPRLAIEVAEAAWTPTTLTLEADAAALDWTAEDAALRFAQGRISLRAAEGAGRLTLRGAFEASGPFGATRLRKLFGPIDLEATWEDGGLRVGPGGARCARLQAERLDAPGLTFDPFRLGYCPAPGGAYFVRRNGVAGGGLDIDAITLRGRLSDGSQAPATLSLAGARVRFSGGGGRLETAVAGQAPTLTIQFSPERTFRATAPALTGVVSAGGGAWRAQGRIAGARIEDPALPVRVEEVAGAWSAAPVNGRAPLRFSGSARVSDMAQRTRFAPLTVSIAEAVLDEGRIVAEGAFATAAQDVRLGRFAAIHRLDDGAGAADIVADTLTFSPELELAAVTPLALGVVENVRGPVDAHARATWGAGGAFAVSGALELGGVSAATAGLGVIEGVRGRVQFDDLLTLTTPPGQTLAVGSVNPGIEVRDGAVRFQLLPAQQVRVEDVRFSFSGGTLSVDPTIVTIGAPESRYTLRLTEVDVATFLADLKLSNLAATGRIGGTLPLILEPLGGRIEGGRLTAAPGGGVISYVGPGSESETAGGQLAFDALKGFRYDALTLTVDGAIDGELVSTIRFEGVNLEPVRPIPQFPQLAGRELPFRYNVTVSAPFKALVQQATDTLNPLSLIGRAQVETGSGPVQPGPDSPERRD